MSSFFLDVYSCCHTSCLARLDVVFLNESSVTSMFDFVLHKCCLRSKSTCFSTEFGINRRLCESRKRVFGQRNIGVDLRQPIGAESGRVLVQTISQIVTGEHAARGDSLTELWSLHTKLK